MSSAPDPRQPTDEVIENTAGETTEASSLGPESASTVNSAASSLAPHVFHLNIYPSDHPSTRTQPSHGDASTGASRQSSFSSRFTKTEIQEITAAAYNAAYHGAYNAADAAKELERRKSLREISNSSRPGSFTFHPSSRRSHQSKRPGILSQTASCLSGAACSAAASAARGACLAGGFVLGAHGAALAAKHIGEMYSV